MLYTICSHKNVMSASCKITMYTRRNFSHAGEIEELKSETPRSKIFKIYASAQARDLAFVKLDADKIDQSDAANDIYGGGILLVSNNVLRKYLHVSVYAQHQRNVDSRGALIV